MGVRCQHTHTKRGRPQRLAYGAKSRPGLATAPIAHAARLSGSLLSARDTAKVLTIACPKTRLISNRRVVCP